MSRAERLEVIRRDPYLEPVARYVREREKQH